MKFIDNQNIVKLRSSINVLGERFGNDAISDALKRLYDGCDMVKYREDMCNDNPETFLAQLIDELGIEIEVSENDLAKIPETGDFCTLSNHPYGALDTLLLLHVIRRVRKDYRCIAPRSLSAELPFFDLALSPEILEKEQTGDKAWGFFFANENSDTLTTDEVKRKRLAADLKLMDTIIKKELPVQPVAISVTNMLRFYLEATILAKMLKTTLPLAWDSKKNKVIKIRIGNLISADHQLKMGTTRELRSVLRGKLNTMIFPMFDAEDKKPHSNESEPMEPIIEAIPNEVVRKEIASFRPDDLLFKMNNYSIYCVDSIRIPNILHEIGRLRELTFRQVGEGTGKSLDLDEYDMYYHHLFIWDEDAHKIVGAYRIGKGKEVIDQHGIKGFYLYSLFKMKRTLLPTLYQSLELGRSFIIPDYQRKPLPLFLLWKGILYFLLKHPEYRYLTGPVTISGKYQGLSKEFIVRYISKYYWDKENAAKVTPRMPLHLPKMTADDLMLLNHQNGELSQLDKLVEDIEPDGEKLPILLKKYLSLNGKILGFNVDPDFNMCLDGLLLLDLYDVPMKNIVSLSKELHDDTILKRFTTE